MRNPIRTFGIAASILLLLMMGAFPAIALSFGGSYENDLLGLMKNDGSNAVGDLNRLRIKLDHDFSDRLTVHVEPRYYLLSKSKDIPLTGASDLSQVAWDRVYAKYRADRWSLTAGKQRIAWGTGYIWNPVDIFNPMVLSFAVRDEDKINVESLRLEVPVGEAGGIDAFVLTGKPWEQTTKGIRVRGTQGLFDLALSYVDQGALGHQIGLETAGDIVKDVGLRGEVAFKTGAVGNNYIQAVAGGDYTLENGIGLNLEYYYNGSGNRDRNDYSWGADPVGMDYLFLSGNKILDELTTVTVSLLTNMDDQSFMIYPQYARNIGQNLDLNLEAMLLGGPGGSEFVPPAAFDPYGFGGSKMALIRLIYSF
ncbi:MAG TPA: hypothetical protein VMD02_04355 [Candidatus Omnitrophota bacterium]|nr:hypothetical protein [Candidatus Omnitrophota bacterium]